MDYDSIFRMTGIASLYTTSSLSESIGSEDEKDLEMADEKIECYHTWASSEELEVLADYRVA